MTRKMWFAGVIALAAGMLAPQAGQAAFSLTLSSSGITSVTVNDRIDLAPPPDGAIATDQDGRKNEILLTPGGTFGTFTNSSSVSAPVFSIGTSAASSTSPGNPSLAMVTESALFVTNLSETSRTLTITVTDDGFTAPGQAGETLFLNTTLSYLFGNGTVTSVATASPQSASTSPISLSAGGFVPSPTTSFLRTGSSFTLTNVLTITLAAGGSVSFQANASITPAPVPATAIMLLAAAPVLGLARRLRRGSVGAPLAL